MLALLLNAIYRRFLSAALPGMTSQRAMRWPTQSRLLFSISIFLANAVDEFRALIGKLFHRPT
jgi:hypothetical protein